MKTLIISPTYNEKENIATVIQEVFKRDLNYHMLIVDDNSPDGTASIVENMPSGYACMLGYGVDIMMIPAKKGKGV